MIHRKRAQSHFTLVLSAKKVLQKFLRVLFGSLSLYTELWTLLCLLSNDQLSVFGGFTLRLMCYLLD